ncbi:MAG: T9SS type A sorting domain-containing protein [bacterium]
MGFIRLLFSALLILLLAGSALAGQWVPSPTTIPGSSGTFEAGGGCCAWAKTTGDHMLFFDVWSGSWTELTLPAAHTLVRVVGAGNLILVVCEDLAVVYNGPRQAVHQQALSGTLLDTGYTIPSFDCAEELAVIVTDDMFYVFDARMDQWRVLDYVYPAGYTNFRGVVAEPDYVATELNPPYPERPINLAYSLRTRTFLETYEGIMNLNSGWALDHGFAGLSGTWPDYWALGWSAFTGEMTVGAYADDGGLGGLPLSREGRGLCHLGGFKRSITLEPFVSEENIWVYDTITGDWEHTSFTHDTHDYTTYSNLNVGGQCLSLITRDDDDYSNSILFFNGQTHGFSTHTPGLIGTSLGIQMGGSVAAYKEDQNLQPPVWWCRSLEHPTGQYTTSSRDWITCVLAGDEWFSTGQYSSGDPLMDLFYYHGPTNTMTQVETWTQIGGQQVGGDHVSCLVTYDVDAEVNFYSGVLNVVQQRTVPVTYGLGQLVNDYLALVYYNGEGDYLFDARTGAVQSRGVDFNSSSLGTEVVFGFDPAGYIAHAYSTITGSWATQVLGENGYGSGGGFVGYARTWGGSRFWGFNALDGTWTELVTTGALPSQDVGRNTIIVRSSDRVWAYWPYDTIDVAEEPEPQAVALSHALGGVKCHPNPFNGRAVVDFALPVPAQVRVEILDLRGRRVAILLDEHREPGQITAIWETGRVPSGTYVVRLEANGRVATKKLMLVQ